MLWFTVQAYGSVCLMTTILHDTQQRNPTIPVSQTWEGTSRLEMQFSTIMLTYASLYKLLITSVNEHINKEKILKQKNYPTLLELKVDAKVHRIMSKYS